MFRIWGLLVIVWVELFEFYSTDSELGQTFRFYSGNGRERKSVESGKVRAKWINGQTKLIRQIWPISELRVAKKVISRKTGETISRKIKSRYFWIP